MVVCCNLSFALTISNLLRNKEPLKVLWSTKDPFGPLQVVLKQKGSWYLEIQKAASFEV